MAFGGEVAAAPALGEAPVSFFAEQMLNGLGYGLLLFLIAAGLSLVFGVMHLINLAHGSLYMVGAFALAALAALVGNFWLSLAGGLVAVAVLAWLLEFLVIRRLYRLTHLQQVLATFGLILFFNDALRWMSGGVPLFVPTPAALSGTVTLPGGIPYSEYRLFVMAVSILVAAGLWLIIARTKAGMLVRAAASNPAMVRHIGYDVGVISMLVFVAGAVLAGLAGILIGPMVSIEVGMGEQVLILAFVIVVIGRMGSIQGTFLAAILVGLVDSMGRAYAPLLMGGLLDTRDLASAAPALSATLVYVLMTIVLIFRTEGRAAR